MASFLQLATWIQQEPAESWFLNWLSLQIPPVKRIPGKIWQRWGNKEWWGWWCRIDFLVASLSWRSRQDKVQDSTRTSWHAALRICHSWTRPIPIETVIVTRIPNRCEQCFELSYGESRGQMVWQWGTVTPPTGCKKLKDLNWVCNISWQLIIAYQRRQLVSRDIVLTLYSP